MRERPSGQATFDFTPVSQKTVDRIDALERIVDAFPDQILHFVEADLTERATHPDRGRRGMSADQVLRAALVKQMNGVSYERLFFQIDDSNRIRRFVGYEFERVPAASTLHENISAIREETWEEVNDALVRFAVKERIEDLGAIRLDTANVEADIHHPTDASLLHDGIRVIARTCKQAKKRWPKLVFDFHDRTRASKKIAFKIANAKSADKKTKLYRKLVPLAKETLGYGRAAVRALRTHPFGNMDEKADAMRVAEALKEICDLLNRVIGQTRRRVFEGESVPADEKVVSIFEPYACILEKGKRDTEFGRKVCLNMGK
jgi:IS5 family transposase